MIWATGTQEDGKPVLNNHLRFTILYHRDLETDLARIVGFEVEPFSVKHSYEGTWDATGANAAVPEVSAARMHCCAGPLRGLPQRPTSKGAGDCTGRSKTCLASLSCSSSVSQLHPAPLAGKKKPELKTCNPGSMKFVTDKEPKQPVEADQEVIFTYDVLFQVCCDGVNSSTIFFSLYGAPFRMHSSAGKPCGWPLAASLCNDATASCGFSLKPLARAQPSDVRWASRWDTYLLMMDDQIHWFSIINSLMIVLFLSGMVAMIMMRTLHRDISNYNQLETAEEVQDETGWKLVRTTARFAGRWRFSQ